MKGESETDKENTDLTTHENEGGNGGDNYMRV